MLAKRKDSENEKEEEEREADLVLLTEQLGVVEVEIAGQQATIKAVSHLPECAG